ncbi:MAG: hypothetical protein ABSA41_12005 [Terriglobia bacterium]
MTAIRMKATTAHGSFRVRELVPFHSPVINSKTVLTQVSAMATARPASLGQPLCPNRFAV